MTSSEDMANNLYPPNADSELEDYSVEEIALKEDHSYNARGIENDILKQKKYFRPWIFWVLLAIVGIFYALAITLVIGIFCALYSGLICDVPHGILILLSALCITPTALLILSIKSLFSDASSLESGLSGLGEIIKTFLDNK